MGKKFDLKLYDLKIINLFFNYDNYYFTKIQQIENLFNYRTFVTVISFSNNQELSACFVQNIPSWVKGIALDNKNILIVNNNDLETLRIVIHEYIHIVIDKTFAQQCPLWLNEGIAMYLSGQKMRITSSSLDINNIYDVNFENDNFYMIAYYVTKSIMDKYGECFVIKRAINCECFEKDEIFGIDNITKIVREIK